MSERYRNLRSSFSSALYLDEQRGPFTVNALGILESEHEHEAFTLLRDKMNCTVRFGKCFLRVPLAYWSYCLVPRCHGKIGELIKTAPKTYCTVYSSFCLLVILSHCLPDINMLRRIQFSLQEAPQFLFQHIRVVVSPELMRIASFLYPT